MDHRPSGVASDALIHPGAVVAPGARIAPGCRIGPGCVVGPDCVLDEGVELVAHVVLDGRTHLGPGVRVSPFATIGLPPQDLKYKGEPTGVVIGARTHVREHTTIHRGSTGGDGITRIGADCLIMCVAHVGHDCRLGDGVILVNNVMLAGHVQIGDFAVIQGGAAIQQFVRIGRMALVAGMSGVERNVLPFGRVKGFRAKLAGLNTIALRRRAGLSKEQVMVVARAVHDLYRAGRPEDQVDAIAQAHPGNALVAEILDFVRERGRHGLCPFGRGTEDEDADAA
ncbi:acyl-ACP--UDP-N-acetylglucosamine O-acyltransferase [Falsiroseomonas oryziterrae]|uniref:acyl-ACP--UDP-N-acetylglucosamine O-acyltransferase n=1 Tax=Falsiroseomonas oryziterrae TaxID=2911368 RepID=UPI001EFFA34A|nr:acyl-ACP--UDP-N-acetylglucosamine O-acyltransferase [Roseomonas sp. NPKOSM-4]